MVNELLDSVLPRVLYTVARLFCRSFSAVTLSSKRVAHHLAGLLFALTAIGSAQEPAVPTELLHNWRRLQGNRLTFCVDPNSYTYRFDRAVGTQLAETLLLTPAFQEVPGSFPIDGDGMWDELLLALTNQCDLALGYALVANGYPDWLTITRPYATFPYVVATTEASYERLADLPPGSVVGTQIVSMADLRFIAYQRQQTKGHRWQRLAYGSNELLVERLLDGTLDAILIWEPALYAALGPAPENEGVHVIDSDPLTNLETRIGGVLRRQDGFVRTQLDDAITALVEDGTIRRLLEEAAVGGRVGE